MPQVRRHRLGVDGLGEMEVPPLPLRQLLQPDVPDEVTRTPCERCLECLGGNAAPLQRPAVE